MSVGGEAGVAWVEGHLVPMEQARIPVTDRGFLFGDSVFETIRTYGGEPFLLGDHLDRLERSAGALDLELPAGRVGWPRVVDVLLGARAFAGEASVRLIVTRGDGGAGLGFPDRPAPRVVLLCRPAPALPQTHRERGVALVRPGGRPQIVPRRGGVKSGAYLENVLALRAAAQAGGFEGLLRGHDGSWGEATTSNLFLVQGGALVTPGPESGILLGVTRGVVLELARRMDLPTVIRPVGDRDLETADEAFITSTLKEILPATSLDGVPLGGDAPGSVTLGLIHAFDALVREAQARGLSRLQDLPPGWRPADPSPGR